MEKIDWLPIISLIAALTAALVFIFTPVGVP